MILVQYYILCEIVPMITTILSINCTNVYTFIGVGVGAAGPALAGPLLGKDHKAGLLFIKFAS